MQPHPSQLRSYTCVLVGPYQQYASDRCRTQEAPVKHTDSHKACAKDGARPVLKEKNELNVETAIALNRFGLGARPGELQRVDGSHEDWLKDQLAGPPSTGDAFRDLPGTPEILVQVQEVQQMRRARREAEDQEPAPDIVAQYRGVIRRHYLDQVLARYAHAAGTDFPFHERLVHFWTNHFAVSADKQPLTALAGAFENEAIRPNISGRFVDLLMAAVKHPAMIVYLDNQRSIGPNSRAGSRANRRRADRTIGLNENLAREILELHTLGVDGGYRQDDVTSFAKIITGWSVGGGERRMFREGTPGEFEFRENIHEPGTHTVLGTHYAQKDIAQGEAVLRDLAHHPATARHLATKLARHFITDAPPSALIDRLTETYLDSNGDLPAVHAALVDAPEAWQSVTAKYKAPHDFVISAFRAFGRTPDDARFVIGALDMMGQTPYRPGSPAGWPDTADEWGGADALYKRIEWSNAVARYAGDRVNPVDLADAVLGPGLSQNTRTAIGRAESVQQGLTLLLASPDFQRR